MKQDVLFFIGKIRERVKENAETHDTLGDVLFYCDRIENEYMKLQVKHNRIVSFLEYLACSLK